MLPPWPKVTPEPPKPSAIQVTIGGDGSISYFAEVEVHTTPDEARKALERVIMRNPCRFPDEHSALRGFRKPRDN